MIARARVAARGAVQGVGFRPFVYRLATDLGLAGWVLNSSAGVFIEVEGERDAVERFLARLGPERPPRAAIHSLETSWLDPAGHLGFEIRESADGGAPTTLVMSDIATCADCLREIRDPADRRFRYPFTNCTNCGPRFTIVEGLPYDRPQTAMKGFTMCPACRREYEDSRNRRFHAQPNACPACGPQLALWDDRGQVRARADAALAGAVAALADGAIVAVKGLGGFHLMVDAADARAVARLRERKHREEKPLAVMFPSLDAVCAVCAVSPLEARLLASPESPIVLVARWTGAVSAIAEGVAPGNPYLGVMLPYTPLHHLLLGDAGRTLVATSGNRSDEPICTDEREALIRLGGLADLFLVHDRPIVRHADDSIVRVMLGRELLLRRARGYAPLPLPLAGRGAGAPPLLAVGAHLKNTVAVSAGSNAFLSQHIGDLETPEARAAFEGVIDSFRALYRLEPAAVAADLHPDYVSTRFARAQGLPVVGVQHHVAHVAACLAENDLDGPALGVSWDGTGYGPDGTVWGGEFFRADGGGFTRVAALGRFRLPGGERAVKEPRRSALGVLHAVLGPHLRERRDLPPVRAFQAGELDVLLQMLDKGVNAPETSSAGRLFDAAAALAGVRQVMSFEGQAAMELEFLAHGAETGSRAYPVRILEVGPAGPHGPALVVDWRPIISAMLEDLACGISAGTLAARFHQALADAIVAVARAVAERRVVLTGGCFQNRELTERTVRALEAAGFRPYWHQRVPPNDGGIALGQLVVAANQW